MPQYRFAAVTVRVASPSPFAADYLKEYRVDTDTYDEDITPAASDLAAETALLPQAPQAVAELSAILRKLADALLMRYNGFVLHAATVIYNETAYAFVAPAGTGKTTHCRLWTQVLGDKARILNGDKLLVRCQNGRIFAYGNPWTGKEGLGEQGCYPLGGIFCLHRADRNDVRTIGTSDALAALLSAVAVSKNGTARMQALTLLDTVLGQVPVHDLYVNMQPDAVYTALSKIGGTQ